MGSWKEEVVTRGSPFSVEKDADTFTESAASSKKRDGRETEERRKRDGRETEERRERDGRDEGAFSVHRLLRVFI